jgi:hypothetical protein
MRRLGIGLALAALLAAISPATAMSDRASQGLCVDDNRPFPNRVGPLSWSAPLQTYDDWDGVSRIDADGEMYAKNPMRLARGAVVSIAIAPHDRRVADVIYGFRRGDVRRLRGCDSRGGSFFSGGFLVTERVCLDFRVRVRGSRRVYDQTWSVGMGAAC